MPTPFNVEDHIRHGNTYGEGRVFIRSATPLLFTNASRSLSATAEFLVTRLTATEADEKTGRMIPRRISVQLDTAHLVSAQIAGRLRMVTPDCVQNSLNVPSLSPDQQNGTVCRMTLG